jgi:hypothetical protein
MSREFSDTSIAYLWRITIKTLETHAQSHCDLLAKTILRYPDNLPIPLAPFASSIHFVATRIRTTYFNAEAMFTPMSSEELISCFSLSSHVSSPSSNIPINRSAFAALNM